MPAGGKAFALLHLDTPFSPPIATFLALCLLDPDLQRPMYPNSHMRQYQHQAIATASPERLVVKLYDLGIAACYRDDRPKVRAVLVELMAALNHERGGELAGRLQAIYEYCLNESAMGNLSLVAELLAGLREAWQEGVVRRSVA